MIIIMSPSSVVQHCTTEEGERVVENFCCVIIVTIKFVDQDNIEFLSCLLYIRQPVEFFNAIYIYMHKVSLIFCLFKSSYHNVLRS